MFTIKKITDLAHHAVRPVIQAGDVVIDATAGNGLDTVFLAQQTGPGGHVYAFDIQEEALESTAAKLKESNLEKWVTLILDGHENMAEYVNGPVSVIMYNLGYLPGAGSRISTRFDTTLRSFQQALALLKPEGMISIVLYPGHRQGKLEKEGLLKVFEELPPSEYLVLHQCYLNKSSEPPELVVIQKILFPGS